MVKKFTFSTFFLLVFRDHPDISLKKIEKNCKWRDQNVEKFRKIEHTGVIQFFIIFSKYRGDLEKQAKNKKFFGIFSWFLGFFQHTGVTKIYSFFRFCFVIYRGDVEKHWKKSVKKNICFLILGREN